MLVLLDAGLLGIAVNPNISGPAIEFRKWLESLAARGHSVGLPEIADYEVRRELLRARLTRAVARLDFVRLSGSTPVASGNSTH